MNTQAKNIDKHFKVLFACSEVYPLIKTGGLADVAYSLPLALNELGQDIRIVIPAYRGIKHQVSNLNEIASISISNSEVTIYTATIPATVIPVILVEISDYFDLEGNPYTNNDGTERKDNALKFYLFCEVVKLIGNNQIGLGWQPDIIHCNDWQTAMVPVLLNGTHKNIGTVFTIHNLAYQGIFPYQTFVDLKLPEQLWDYTKLEFYGQMSFIKGGIVFANQVTTVSPSYTKEIQTKEFGCGLDALLKHSTNKLSGILNGINESEWNPLKDKMISVNYDASTVSKKNKNKRSLQKLFNLKEDKSIPLFVNVSRLVAQKGIDLIIETIPLIRNFNMQILILGSGDKAMENQLLALANDNPEQVAVKIGYDEKLAHMLTAGGDYFVMPSRFEPCGLNQMYSQRYGTLPIVTSVGGLKDTVVDINNQKNSVATGIKMNSTTSKDLLHAIICALNLYADTKQYKQIQANAMRASFSWQKSAIDYLDIYSKSLN